MTTQINDPARLDDLIAITTVKTRYTRYLDTKRWDEWGALFTEDAVMQMSDSAADDVNGREAIVKMLKKHVGKAVTVHNISPGEITFTGEDSADVIWPMFDEVESSQFHLKGHGYYKEQYCRVEGEWKISHWRELRLRLDWKPKSFATRLAIVAWRSGLLGLLAPAAAERLSQHIDAVIKPGDLP